MHQSQERILTGIVLATQPQRQEMCTHHHSTCKVSELQQGLQLKDLSDHGTLKDPKALSHWHYGY